MYAFLHACGIESSKVTLPSLVVGLTTPAPVPQPLPRLSPRTSEVLPASWARVTPICSLGRWIFVELCVTLLSLSILIPSPPNSPINDRRQPKDEPRQIWTPIAKSIRRMRWHSRRARRPAPFSRTPGILSRAPACPPTSLFPPQRHIVLPVQGADPILTTPHSRPAGDDAKASPHCTSLSPPKDTLSDDELFEDTLASIKGRIETRVIRDIAQLIVPFAEILAMRGAKHLKSLRETTKAGWNNAILFCRPRPQPDYSLGFKREAFTQEQLQTL
ncbi:predicted protein [Plenodomus lingam JN3]|uniref:Predicted protein n=1 Tax=Leptosphaeria maculans (strain JN3 / isolate v23.1.3 / race Av1-4-5-6-7-8) TaxID=985895 RepID=E5ADY6_LEPMJ|nr:predicted protein [Plenodomus lingam JN3]CBY01425.1 predicted protein [Plenodomus lingam JN3]